jgi:hypothetical protein
VAVELPYHVAVAPIQAIRHAEDSGQNTQAAPVACRQDGVFGMHAGWQGLAVIAGDQSDKLTLLPGEGKILRLHDQAKRCLVMAFDPLHPADVVEHRTALEEKPIVRPKAMELLKLVEQLKRKPCHLVGVTRFIPTPPGEGHDSLQAGLIFRSRTNERRRPSGPRRPSREVSQWLSLQQHAGKFFREPSRPNGLDGACHVVANPSLLDA